MFSLIMSLILVSGKEICSGLSLESFQVVGALFYLQEGE